MILMSKKQKALITLGIVTVIILTIAFSIPFIKYINNPNSLKQLIKSFNSFSIIAYLILVIIQILIPFIPGEPFELFAGYGFGFVKGSILCFVAESIGSLIVIFIVRKIEKNYISIYFKEKDIKKLEYLKSKKAFIVYVILFIVPGTPKDLLCFVGALFEYDLIPLIIVTSIGRLPAILTSTITSSAFSNQKYTFSIITFLITALVSTIGLIIYNLLNKKDCQHI